jgi:hypothetical protein
MKTNIILLNQLYLGVFIMEFEYLKSDTKRIEKKLEQLNQKYLDIQHQKELDKIEARCKEINSAPDPDMKEEIWGQIYRDVLDLEKKADKKKVSDKKKKKDDEKD